MSPKPTPTTDRAHELLRYEDGELYWRNPNRHRNCSTGPLGTRAGDHGERLQVIIDGRATYVHHLVWLMHRGAWPTRQVDHINGDQLDNRIENLRLATNAENCRNRKHRGVTFDPRWRNGRWRARIMINGRSISLGHYDTEREAMDAYERAKLRLHESYATGVGQVA